jgi:hypothetical protein
MEGFLTDDGRDRFGRLREPRERGIRAKITLGLATPRRAQGALNDEHTRGEAGFNRLTFPPQTGCCSVRRSLDVGEVVGRASSHRLAQ